MRADKTCVCSQAQPIPQRCDGFETQKCNTKALGSNNVTNVKTVINIYNRGEWQPEPKDMLKLCRCIARSSVCPGNVQLRYQGFLPCGGFLPFFFQSGSCSPRAQLSRPETSLPGALGMFSMVSKMPRMSSLGSDMLPDLVGTPLMGASLLHDATPGSDKNPSAVITTAQHQNMKAWPPAACVRKGPSLAASQHQRK